MAGCGPMAVLLLAMLVGGSLIIFLAFWGGVSKAWTGARTFLRRLPKGDWLEKLLDSCRYFGHRPAFLLRTLGISMILNAFCVLQVWLLSKGLNLDISPIALLVIVPIIICISALPITPSGLGVRENLFVFMLADPSINVAATPALSLSLLAYAGSLFWSLVGGVVYLMFKERHHLADAELVNSRSPEDIASLPRPPPPAKPLAPLTCRGESKSASPALDGWPALSNYLNRWINCCSLMMKPTCSIRSAESSIPRISN